MLLCAPSVQAAGRLDEQLQQLLAGHPQVRAACGSRLVIDHLVGLGIVGICAELTVSGAIAVAAALNISETFVAVIIIGLGTSLPELSISIAAVMKQRARMSVGNLVGSNIFDTLVPVGAAAAISTLRFDENLLRYELPFLFFLTLIVLIFFLRKRGIQKGEAIIVLALYGGYLLLKLSQAF